MTVKLEKHMVEIVSFTDINGTIHELDFFDIFGVGYSNNEKGYYIELEPNEDRLTIDEDTFNVLRELVEERGNEYNESL